MPAHTFHVGEDGAELLAQCASVRCLQDSIMLSIFDTCQRPELSKEPHGMEKQPWQRTVCVFCCELACCELISRNGCLSVSRI